jgi:hypothetical protein
MSRKRQLLTARPHGADQFWIDAKGAETIVWEEFMNFSVNRFSLISPIPDDEDSFQAVRMMILNGARHNVLVQGTLNNKRMALAEAFKLLFSAPKVKLLAELIDASIQSGKSPSPTIPRLPPRSAVDTRNQTQHLLEGNPNQDPLAGEPMQDPLVGRTTQLRALNKRPVII